MLIERTQTLAEERPRFGWRRLIVMVSRGMVRGTSISASLLHSGPMPQQGVSILSKSLSTLLGG